jgi:hypothetical protein
LKLIGFKDFTEESKHMNILMNHKKNVCVCAKRMFIKTLFDCAPSILKNVTLKPNIAK